MIVIIWDILSVTLHGILEHKITLTRELHRRGDRTPIGGHLGLFADHFAQIEIVLHHELMTRDLLHVAVVSLWCFRSRRGNDFLFLFVY